MTERFEPGRAAVIGAGVMGAGIAAHLANAGLDVLLLDIVPRELLPEEEAAGLTLESPAVRNRMAAGGLAKARKAKPAAFYVPDAATRVSVGNLEDDLPRLGDVDWVIEAVIEDPRIKASLFERIAPHMKDGAVLSSNTSGIPAAALSTALPEALRPRFLITHFFNPPRYLHLLELVAAPETDPALMTAVADFAERDLGKGCVIAKDTPNFIANRIGTYAVMQLFKLLESGEANVAEIDALTGELIGRPKSATFRTADVVGLDTLLYVAGHLHQALREDPERDVFQPPELLQRLVKEGRLGAKSGAGFYRKEKDEQGKSRILMLDPTSFEYVEQTPLDPAEVGKAARIPDAGQRVAALIAGGGRVGELLWNHLSATLVYAARLVPTISDELPAVDRALRWGFGWALGPFELLDALGVANVAERLAAEDRHMPGVVKGLLASGAESFYAQEGGHATVFEPAHDRHVELAPRPRVIELSARRAAGAVVDGNAEASLIDLGEDVVCLQFHSLMNTLGEGTGEMLERAVERAESEFRGLVIGNQADAFSAGANLKLVLGLIEGGHYDAVGELVAGFQAVNQRLRFSRRPVITCPRGLTLGGGCEISLHGARICATAETYMGLVEVGAGLIPAAGGCKEVVRRIDESLPAKLHVDLLPFVQRAFETLGMARVSTSAAHARALAFLGPNDRIVMNADQQIHAARQMVLDLDRDGYRPPTPRTNLRVIGSTGTAAVQVGLWNMVESRMVSEYDRVVAGKLGYVLCGGDVSIGTRVSEQHLLDLEREAFVSLCGEKNTQARMLHLLKTGKPLRN